MQVQKQEIAEQTLVEAFAEDISVHGWKVTSYSVKQDTEKQERTLSVSAKRSTGDAQQENMNLADGDKPRRRRGARTEGGGEEAT